MLSLFCWIIFIFRTIHHECKQLWNTYVPKYYKLAFFHWLSDDQLSRLGPRYWWMHTLQTHQGCKVISRFELNILIKPRQFFSCRWGSFSFAVTCPNNVQFALNSRPDPCLTAIYNANLCIFVMSFIVQFASRLCAHWNDFIHGTCHAAEYVSSTEKG